MRSLLVTLAAGLLLAPSVPLVSQQPAADTASAPAAHRARPFGYFARSLLIPGWGQAALDRKVTGGIFVGFEGLALGMMLKAGAELRYLQETGSGLVPQKRQERQDWLVLLMVNHLASALEAYVSANLFDFPGDLRMQQFPGGRTGVGFTLPIGH